MPDLKSIKEIIEYQPAETPVSAKIFRAYRDDLISATLAHELLRLLKFGKYQVIIDRYEGGVTVQIISNLK